MLLGAAIAFVPALFVLEAVVPSRENTQLDELPHLLASMGITGLAVAGVVMVGYAIIAPRWHTRVGSARLGRLQSPAMDDGVYRMLESRRRGEQEGMPATSERATVPPAETNGMPRGTM